MNLLDIFFKGGFIMWFILLSSIIGLAVSIDRFIMLRKAKINVPAFMKDHYVKIGYQTFSKINFLNKVIKIYITYFRKVRIIFKILFKSKFIFKDPSKKDLIIYDIQV